MRRRTLLSASLGMGALAGLASVGAVPGSPLTASLPVNTALAGLTLYSGSDLAFGTTVTIKVLHGDALSARAAIQDALLEVRKIDALMSLHQERSQVFQLNRDGILAAPDNHLLYVLKYAQQLSRLTAGAFDITVQPLWRAFSEARSRGTLPAPEQIAAARSLANWRQLEVHQQQVRLNTAGMAITLNGLAQGYAVDLALAALQARGVQHALLDTGEFGAIGNKTSAQPWILGINHPRQANAISAEIEMDGRKVATSGDYATTFSSDFVHHHIFDPASGDSPLALASVTVVAPTGIMADGLSTAFMVMGADKAFALAAQLQDVDILLIDKNGAIRKTAHFPEVQA
ncbi:FAD:protein FMN transferase [Herminiimonas sp. CN]|uniref:FAD:protein FMN transferase n=1 Tax=Herminiimonas sp. CN TaxID=1349818 RepID=UPI000473717F|nr:FAD:protein FMN transferase [Herminiimonas sp. CN]